MPFTPFHLGPALVLGLLLFRYLNLPAFLIGNVIVDVEPFIVLLFNLDYPLHGFFHSFLGGSVAALILYFAVIGCYPRIRGVMDTFGVGQELSKGKIFLSSFLGVYLHIFLDSLLYTDIRPFFPFDANPFLSLGVSGSLVYSFCVAGFILGVIVFCYRLLKKEESS